MTYFLKTYGCQYNEWEAARIDYMLQKIGLVPTDDKTADVIFIIACAVRKSAVDRIFGQVKNFQGKKIVISGCIISSDVKKFQDRHAFIWDTAHPETLKDILSPQADSDSLDWANLDALFAEGNTQSSYLPIMSGCNNFCTYCAVPYTKGREISRPFEEIVRDFQILVDKGARQIMLLGQNVNSYQFGFARLLKTLNALPGDFQITFTSNHPKDMTDEVIDAIAGCDKVVKLIHLPLQSGSNAILKAMNRPYTREQYLALVDKIKTRIPNIEITTDVIVGFPGETEADFQETVDIFKQVKYSVAYINKYSPRPGTVAYRLGDPIPWSEKQRRWRLLEDLIKTRSV